MAGRMSCTSTGDGNLMDATFLGMIITDVPNTVGSISSSVLFMSLKNLEVKNYSNKMCQNQRVMIL
jgi:hypothetical protein